MSHQRVVSGPGGDALQRLPEAEAASSPGAPARPARTAARPGRAVVGWTIRMVRRGRTAACCSGGRLHAARGRQLQPHVPERRQCRAILDLRRQPCGAHAPGSAARPRRRRRFRGLGRRLGAGDRHRGLGGARRDQAASRRGGRGAGRAAPRRPRPGTAPDRAHATGGGCLLVDHRRRGLGRAAEHRRRIPPGRRCSVSAWPDSPPRSRESRP